MAVSYKRNIVQKLVFNQAGSVSYTFNNSSYNYLNNTINQDYNEITVRNFSEHDMYFTLENNNSLALDGNDLQGVYYLGARDNVTISNIDSIKYVKVSLAGEGKGEINLTRYNVAMVK